MQPFSISSHFPEGTGRNRKTKKPTRRLVFIIIRCVKGLLLLLKTKLLNIDSLLERHALLHGRLLEVFAGAHLANGAGLFELALELFQGSLDVFAFFDGNDDHAFYTSFCFQMGCKVRKILTTDKIFYYICGNTIVITLKTKLKAI